MVVVSAGTSDAPVAAEAALTARVHGAGVAGSSRTSAWPGCTGCSPSRAELEAADCLVVVAGMEGALPSVVGGLVGVPIVAVPTSVGLRRLASAVSPPCSRCSTRAPRGQRGQHRQRLRRRGVAARVAASAAPRPSGQPEDRVIGWLDATAGASGDMLLGALLDAGVPLEVLAGRSAAVAPEAVALATAARCTGGGLARHPVPVVEVADCSTPPHLGRRRARSSTRRPSTRRCASARTATFARLAAAEAAVHGIAVEEVHFHEVGALDAIADVVGVCAGFAHLGLDAARGLPGRRRLRAGRARPTAACPVPVPAVVELLRGFPSSPGPGAAESCTPTGAALLSTLGHRARPAAADGGGPGRRRAPAAATRTRTRTSCGCCSGEPVTGAAPADGTAVVLETNVDDLDPRLWPGVIAALLAAGASDAWLTPILMKKGRPAHTLSVLVVARVARPRSGVWSSSRPRPSASARSATPRPRSTARSGPSRRTATPSG